MIEKILKSNVQEIINAEELEQKLRSGKPLNIKLGVDPTSPDLHLGHAVVLRKLAQFQEAGHQTFLIIGDFTASIGDPAGANKTRPVLTSEEIRHNMQTYVEQAAKVIDLEKTHIVYNSQWLKTMGLSEFFKYTMNVTLQQVIEREDFAKRISENQPIGLHEVMYSLVQGIDSVHLKADVEIGGWDQRLNLLTGRELQRKLGYPEQSLVLVKPLIGTDGVKKMSKSLNNYIGLYEVPNQMFGKLMRIKDELTDAYAESHEIIIPSEITHPKERKMFVAKKIVEIYHGTESAKTAEASFTNTFSSIGGSVATDLIREVTFPERSVPLIQAVTRCTTTSSSEARRLIDQGAIKLNSEVVDDYLHEVEIIDSPQLQVGKHRFFKLVYKGE
ncbi:tyrosine--tRNA ligase [Candidatus Berkelbacteria bacterium]|nr:tyrosine--tRNA ligase [Candidatus Berkelbacteria bacterium]